MNFFKLSGREIEFQNKDSVEEVVKDLSDSEYLTLREFLVEISETGVLVDADEKRPDRPFAIMANNILRNVVPSSSQLVVGGGLVDQIDLFRNGDQTTAGGNDISIESESSAEIDNLTQTMNYYLMEAESFFSKLSEAVDAGGSDDSIDIEELATSLISARLKGLIETLVSNIELGDIDADILNTMVNNLSTAYQEEVLHVFKSRIDGLKAIIEPEPEFSKEEISNAKIPGIMDTKELVQDVPSETEEDSLAEVDNKQEEPVKYIEGVQAFTKGVSKMFFKFQSDRIFEDAHENPSPETVEPLGILPVSELNRDKFKQITDKIADEVGSYELNSPDKKEKIRGIKMSILSYQSKWNRDFGRNFAAEKVGFSYVTATESDDYNLVFLKAKTFLQINEFNIIKDYRFPPEALSPKFQADVDRQVKLLLSKILRGVTGLTSNLLVAENEEQIRDYYDELKGFYEMTRETEETIVADKAVRRARAMVKTETYSSRETLKQLTLVKYKEDYLESEIFEGVDVDIIYEQVRTNNNKGALDEQLLDVTNNFLEALMNLADEADERMGFRMTGEDLKFIPPDLDFGTRFNSLISALKVFELNITDKILGIKDSNSEDYRQYAIKDILPSWRVQTLGEEDQNRLARLLTYMTNPSLARYTFDRNKDVLNFNLARLIHATGDGETIRDLIEAKVVKTTNSLWQKVMDQSNDKYGKTEEEGDIGKAEATNFFEQFTLSDSSIIGQVKRDYFGAVPYRNIVFCNTCMKRVTYKYGNYKKAVGSLFGSELSLVTRTVRIPQYDLRRDDNTYLSKRDFLDQDGNEIAFKYNQYQVIDDVETGATNGDPVQDSELSIYEMRGMDKGHGERFTWSEVKDMMVSPDRRKSVSGHVIRASILKTLGASNPTILSLNKTYQECPFGSQNSSNDFESKLGENTCGYTVRETSAESNDEFNLQPIRNPTDELGGVEDVDTSFVDELITNESLRGGVKKKVAGGYKNSYVSFGCPTIWEYDGNSETTTPKHYLMAISLSGDIYSKDYSPPLGKDGLPLPAEERGLATYVCGSMASLSSFDRDPASESYIIKILSEIYHTDIAKYHLVLSFFAKSGIQPDDIMYINDKVSEGAGEEPLPVEARIKLLSKMLKTSSVKVSNVLYAIKDIVLVCPEGHKFTIGKSFSFAKSHSREYIRRDFKKLKQVLKTKGKNQITELINTGILIEANSLQIKNRKIYEDLSEEDDEKLGLKDLIIRFESGELEEGEVEGGKYKIKNYVLASRKMLKRSMFASNSQLNYSHESPLDVIDWDFAHSENERSASVEISENVAGLDDGMTLLSNLAAPEVFTDYSELDQDELIDKISLTLEEVTRLLIKGAVFTKTAISKALPQNVRKSLVDYKKFTHKVEELVMNIIVNINPNLREINPETREPFFDDVIHNISHVILREYAFGTNHSEILDAYLEAYVDAVKGAKYFDEESGEMADVSSAALRKQVADELSTGDESIKMLIERGDQKSSVASMINIIAMAFQVAAGFGVIMNGNLKIHENRIGATFDFKSLLDPYDFMQNGINNSFEFESDRALDELSRTFGSNKERLELETILDASLTTVSALTAEITRLGSAKLMPYAIVNARKILNDRLNIEMLDIIGPIGNDVVNLVIKSGETNARGIGKILRENKVEGSGALAKNISMFFRAKSEMEGLVPTVLQFNSSVNNNILPYFTKELNSENFNDAGQSLGYMVLDDGSIVNAGNNFDSKKHQICQIKPLGGKLWPIVRENTFGFPLPIHVEDSVMKNTKSFSNIKNVQLHGLKLIIETENTSSGSIDLTRFIVRGSQNEDPAIIRIEDEIEVLIQRYKMMVKNLVKERLRGGVKSDLTFKKKILKLKQKCNKILENLHQKMDYMPVFIYTGGRSLVPTENKGVVRGKIASATILSVPRIRRYLKTPQLIYPEITGEKVDIEAYRETLAVMLNLNEDVYDLNKAVGGNFSKTDILTDKFDGLFSEVQLTNNKIKSYKRGRVETPSPVFNISNASVMSAVDNILGKDGIPSMAKARNAGRRSNDFMSKDRRLDLADGMKMDRMRDENGEVKRSTNPDSLELSAIHSFFLSKADILPGFEAADDESGEITKESSDKTLFSKISKRRAQLEVTMLLSALTD